MVICGRNFTDDIIGQIKERIKSEPNQSRRSLSRQICQIMDWRSPNGKLQDMSCRKALAKLNSLGLISLPKVKGKFAFENKNDVSQQNVPDHASIRCHLDALGSIEVTPVGARHRQESKDWNGLMEAYHYLGNGPLCGAQIRYLVTSARYGLLGGLSFSAAAWRVAARDQFIGWCDDAHKANLQQVVCNSRFLIVPSVIVPNLASHVLTSALTRLQTDWQERYSYSPVLVETYVQIGRFHGTCYEAANWIKVGATAGRGRQDINNRRDQPRKVVYVFALTSNWREILCRTPAGEVVKLCENESEPQAVDWAEQEFGKADLGDRRLNARLVKLGRSFYGNPGALVPEACDDIAQTKAAYRFFDNDRVGMDNVLQPHHAETVARVKEHQIVLAVQDTTSLNYSTHKNTEGLGRINNSTNEATGLELHNTMAFTPAGTPLGLLHVLCWARDPESVRDKSNIKAVPIEEKESFKWIQSYRAVAEAQSQCPQTRLISVGDRESDIYELFAEAQQYPDGPQLLVRSERSRRRKVVDETSQDARLWEVMAKKPVAGLADVYVPRNGSRKARTACVQVRFAKVTLVPPKSKSHFDPIEVWAVYILEKDCPKGVKPIEWMLLTTVKTVTLDDAIERAQWYAARWNIEIYHRTLKSGCRIEDRQLADADRLERCLAIDMVVAWRIHHLTKLARETPDLPCTVFFEEDEWQALVCYVTKTSVPPEAPPTIESAQRMVASLGGYLGRKQDGPPGTQTTWRGLQKLDIIKLAWQMFSPYAVDKIHAVPQTDYG